MKNNSRHLKNWETALLMALCISFCTGAWAQAKSEALSSKLVRLHVIAVSDDEEEQAIKLSVRDSVLRYLEPKLGGAGSAREARALIESELSGIAEAAGASAEGRPVRVTLGRESYPTRDYGSFSLPAGTYTSLRVVLGEGEGHNWWCVVFPPLCLSAAEAEEAMSTLPEQDKALLTGESDGVILKFRIIELWGELKNWLTK
ncbi:MAG: stage II sporulation protein R [Oscillospiraceae bacterium]